MKKNIYWIFEFCNIIQIEIFVKYWCLILSLIQLKYTSHILFISLFICPTYIFSSNYFLPQFNLGLTSIHSLSEVITSSINLHLEGTTQQFHPGNRKHQGSWWSFSNYLIFGRKTVKSFLINLRSLFQFKGTVQHKLDVMSSWLSWTWSFSLDIR